MVKWVQHKKYSNGKALALLSLAGFFVFLYIFVCYSVEISEANVISRMEKITIGNSMIQYRGFNKIRLRRN